MNEAQISQEDLEIIFDDVPQFDLEAVDKLIRARRSVFPKDYSGESVSRKEVERMLANANWAPNHGKTEPWFFKVFSGKALERLGQAHAELYKTHTPEENFKVDKYKKLQFKPTMASHLIAICMRRGNNPNIPEIEEIEAVACAVHNMHLTATAMGIGAYWSSGGMTYHDSMKDFLGLGHQDQCLGFFYIGRPKKGEWPRGFRKSDSRSKVEWIEE